MSNEQAYIDLLQATVIPPHGVIYVHGAVLKEYIDFFKKKAIGIRIESEGKSFKLVWSKNLNGIKFAKSALVKLQGPWVYPFTFSQMSKQLITHKYLENIGQFFEYVGKPAKSIAIPYREDELYE
ncbi:MAG: hypothetical protein QXE38_05570 [Candidatus Methanomethylicia archaeon]